MLEPGIRATLQRRDVVADDEGQYWLWTSIQRQILL